MSSKGTFCWPILRYNLYPENLGAFSLIFAGNLEIHVVAACSGWLVNRQNKRMI